LESDYVIQITCSQYWPHPSILFSVHGWISPFRRYIGVISYDTIVSFMCSYQWQDLWALHMLSQPNGK